MLHSLPKLYTDFLILAQIPQKNTKLDSGKIILQKKIKINKLDTPNQLAKKVLKLEHTLYPKAIMSLYSNC